MANHLLRVSGEPSAERLEWLHQAMGARLGKQVIRNFRHPLSCRLCRAWLQETIGKTESHSRVRPKSIPAAVTRTPPGWEVFANVTLLSQVNGTEKVGATQALSAHPLLKVNRSRLPGLEMQSILPAVLPLEAVSRMSQTGRRRQSAGAVAMPIRLFFEGLMGFRPQRNPTPRSISNSVTLLRFPQS